jgi:hypothetical protein
VPVPVNSDGFWKKNTPMVASTRNNLKVDPSKSKSAIIEGPLCWHFSILTGVTSNFLTQTLSAIFATHQQQQTTTTTTVAMANHDGDEETITMTRQSNKIAISQPRYISTLGNSAKAVAIRDDLLMR